MAETTHFRITYDGPALAHHEMDVRELAPALLSISDLLDNATRVLKGGTAKPQINVRGSFKTGSFGIDLMLATDWLTAVRDLFASDNASALSNAIEILGAVGLVGWQGKRGLLAVLKWLRGRAITRVELREDDAVLIVDDEQLAIEREVLALLQDLAVRESLDKVLSPLDRTGITTFAAGSDDAVFDTVSEAERAWFHPPSWEDELLFDDVRKMAFSIVSLAFKEDNKWRLYDGAATIHATIQDAGFIERVNQSLEHFAKGDVLICLVRVRQWQTATGARTEYEVTEVLEHRHAARQLRLPFE